MMAAARSVISTAGNQYSFQAAILYKTSLEPICSKNMCSGHAWPNQDSPQASKMYMVSLLSSSIFVLSGEYSYRKQTGSQGKKRWSCQMDEKPSYSVLLPGMGNNEPTVRLPVLVHHPALLGH